jgi:hypothetical protein
MRRKIQLLKRFTDLSLEINHLDSLISCDKSWFSRFKSEITFSEFELRILMDMHYLNVSDEMPMEREPDPHQPSCTDTRKRKFQDVSPICLKYSYVVS